MNKNNTYFDDIPAYVNHFLKLDSLLKNNANIAQKRPFKDDFVQRCFAQSLAITKMFHHIPMLCANKLTRAFSRALKNFMKLFPLK